MQNSYRATALLALALAGSLPGLAQELPRRPVYKTPQAVFAAYKEATNGRDWKTLFSLGTTAYQNAQLMEFAIGAAYSQEDPQHLEEIRTYRAIVAKYGIDWREVRKLVEDAKSGDDKDAFLVPLERMVDRVEKKAELFSAVSDFFAKASDPLEITVRDLKNVVDNGATASGDSIETSIATETATDPQTGRTRKRRIEVEVTSHLFFRRIDGSWYLDVEKKDR